MPRFLWSLPLAAVFLAPILAADGAKAPPRLVGHRGLFHHAPENTLAGFAACLDLKLGFELDVRRSKDGALVLLHDANLERTTGESGPVAGRTLAELKKLDAGRRFDPAFAGERVPTFAEVCDLVKRRGRPDTLVAVDQKAADDTLEADMVEQATKAGVLDRLVFIGLAIEQPAVRKKLRAADRRAHVAVLAKGPDDLARAVAEVNADWVYLRFLPTLEQVASVHKAGKKVFLVGPLVAGQEPENWKKALQVGVDAILTDHPLTCRQAWHGAPK